MAAGGRKAGDSPWWVMGIKVAAGIGAAAIGAYAAARAAEATFREQPMRSSTAEEKPSSNKGEPCHSDSSDSNNDDDHWGNVNDDNEHSGSSDSHSSSKPKRSIEDKLTCVDLSKPLVEQLEEYYTTRVMVSDGEVTAMKAVVEQVAQSITEDICGCHAKLLQGDAFAIGSAYVGTAVHHPDMFTIIVPLGLETNLWKLVDAKNTVLKSPGYSLVHRVNTDVVRPGSSIWDKFLVEMCLNPELIQQYLEGVLHKVANRGFTFCYQDCYIRKSDKTLTLKIIRPVGGLIDHLTIQLVPSVSLEDKNGIVCLEGIPYGYFSEPGYLSEPIKTRAIRSNTRQSDPYENLWQQSTRTLEIEMIQAFEENGSCRKKCFQILKAVHHSQLPLSSIHPYHLKTVFLHLCEEESEWEDVMIAERFFDVLKRLEQYIEDKYLPHFFHREVNLLEGFSPHQLGKIKNWLGRNLSQPGRIFTLLV